MSGRVSLHRWTNHPAFYVFGLVFLMRDVILAGLALGGGLVGGLAHENTLSVVGVVLAALALTGVVASSVAAQRRAGGLHAAYDAPAGLNFDAVPAQPRDAGDEPREEEPVAPVTSHDPVADLVSSGRQLRAEISSAQERGAWDDEGWAYRRRVEAWTERTAAVLEGRGRDDLASALAEVEVGPPPPFESLLKGYSPSYTKLVGLLDGRLGLLEQSQA
jgi:hypothetical protein